LYEFQHVKVNKYCILNNLFSVWYMLDTAKINLRTVAMLQEDPGATVLKTRDVTNELVFELVEPHITRRRNVHGLQKFVKLSIDSFFGKCLFFGPGCGTERLQENPILCALPPLLIVSAE